MLSVASRHQSALPDGVCGNGWVALIGEGPVLESADEAPAGSASA
jgi:hypothetical protein